MKSVAWLIVAPIALAGGILTYAAVKVATSLVKSHFSS